MKMKEQNAYLSLAGFGQIAVVGFIGTGLNEVFKSDANWWLICLALLAGIIAFSFVIRVYQKCLNKKK